jgi:DNA polymerase III subunit chi
MTRIDFFFNVDSKLAKVAELAEAAFKKGRKVTIYAQHQAHAQSLEQSLWQANPTAFVPHCLANSPLACETPIVIDWQTQPLQDDILINLQVEQPTSFSRYLRLIEIVGLEEADKVAARLRYQFYRDRGYTLNCYDALGNAV